MPRQKIYPTPYGGHNCLLCSSLGVGSTQAQAFDESFIEWLSVSGYTHLAIGCHPAETFLDFILPILHRHELMPLFIFHDQSQQSVQSKGEHCWVFSSLSARLDSFDQAIFIPDRSNRHAPLRGWPNGRNLALYWPHPAFLKKFGWKWSDVFNYTQYLRLAYPHLNLRPPEGFDIYNPEIESDLGLEGLPSTRIDIRGARQSDISIIIPVYNNKAGLRSTVRQALSSNHNNFEVLIADDGSTDDLLSDLRKHFAPWPENLVYLHLERPHARQMGKGGFRAGIARNIGSTLSRGKILLFLDSDVLIPADYLNSLMTLHQDYDVVQGRRRQIAREAPQVGTVTYDSIARTQIQPDSPAWEDFQYRSPWWNKIDARWKYVSTYCLSVRREDFFSLGRFRRSFNHYGFEDTELGYRLAQAGKSFFLADSDVFHFRHPTSRSEFKNREAKKQKLLCYSAKVFYLHHLDQKIEFELQKYLVPKGALSWLR